MASVDSSLCTIVGGPMKLARASRRNCCQLYSLRVEKTPTYSIWAVRKRGRCGVGEVGCLHDCPQGSVIQESPRADFHIHAYKQRHFHLQAQVPLPTFPSTSNFNFSTAQNVWGALVSHL